MFTGFKIFAVLGILTVVVGGLAAAYQEIRKAEANRIELRLAEQKAALEKRAEENLQAAQARLHLARVQARSEREKLDDLIKEMDGRDACVLPADFRGQLQSLVGSSTSGSAESAD